MAGVASHLALGDAAGVLLTGAMGAWLAITFLNQFHHGRELIGWLLRYDVCAMVPNWTFFAPNPVRADTHLVYRDIYDDGSYGPWRAIELRDRVGILAVSGGDRRVAKGILDLQDTLLAWEEARVSPSSPPDRAHLEPAPPHLLLSTAYLAYLQVVCQADHTGFAVGTQFALASAEGPDDEVNASVMFVSARHTLETTRSD